MSTFLPTKHNLREALLFCFNLKKSATDGHRLLCEAYGKHALSIKSCEYWFRRFKSGDFDTRDKERGGRPIKFEDAELEALLDEDSSQTQEELAETLGVTQQAISNRLKVMGMVQKQGNWVPYELKPGNIERRICTCELLLKGQNRKGFLHRIVTGDEKWIHYDNPKRRKSWVKPGHASTSTAKPNIHGKKLMLCIWWDQLGVIYYELLQPNETITGERYQQQLMRLSRALKIKRPLYAKRHDKVIYQHDNARPHVAKVVKETLEALQWDVLPHPLYSPDIAPSDYHMFRSITHGLAEQHFTFYEEAKNWVNVWIASKKTRNFFDTESVCCLKDGKKSIMLIPAPPLLRVRSEDPSVYAVKGGGLAFLINNLYYEGIAINIPNTLDLEAQEKFWNFKKANMISFENTIIEAAKGKWKQTCENLNPRNPNTKLWNLAKQIDRVQPQTENTNMIKNTDGTPATNDKIAANLLGNSYQISSKIKVEKRPERLFMTVKMSPALIIFFMKKINMKELAYALENTDLNKTPGPDGIHGRMISNLGKLGKERLLNIFNNSWKTENLPQDCKNATIIPIKNLTNLLMTQKTTDLSPSQVFAAN
ncbi:SETMAR [Cordylochernes scorpioides]|uniref:SETMAR n=1 Tax=Cordylochernes scorpioides TaxID=51811 RepID=A0ABY6KV43_9ARAC|nr:SETMAR [Cordylochernes scorpioides]